MVRLRMNVVFGENRVSELIRRCDPYRVRVSSRSVFDFGDADDTG